jgi:tetratricopeptide (TPR) repeat protein
LFKTPSRESTAKNEENFLSKHQPYLINKNNYTSIDSDENPLRLKEKGDDFYKHKDYASAVNAYTPLLKYSDTIVHALIHRSDCFLQLGDVTSCISDCQQLVTILNSGGVNVISVEEDVSSLKEKIFLQLCCAYCQYGTTTDFDLAFENLQKVKELGGENSTTDRFMKRIEKLKRANQIKTEGDKLFEKEDVAMAIQKYLEALSVDDGFFTAATNLAAAAFSMGRYNDSVQYCTKALEILTREEKMREDYLYVPPPGSMIKKKMMKTIRYRRAKAFEALGRNEEAIVDFDSIRLQQ